MARNRNKNKISTAVQDTSTSKFAPTPEQVVMFEEYGLNELLKACVLGDLEAFKVKLSSTGRQLTVKDAKEGSDAMLWACYAGQSHIVDEILKMDASKIDAKNNNGTNALQMACEFGGLEIAQKIYNRKKHLLILRDKEGKTVMHYACKGKNIAIIEWIHSLDNKLVNVRNEAKETPLEYVLNLDCGVTEEFRNKMLDLQSNGGQTVEQFLASLADDGTLSDGNEETTENPAKKSAIATADNSENRVASTRDSGQQSALLHHKKIAIKKFQEEMAIDQQNASTADNRVAVAAQPVASKAQKTVELFASIHSDDLEKVRVLVQSDASLLLSQNSFGFNAVHTACRSGKWEIAEFLLSKAPNLIKSICTSGNVFDVANRCKDKAVKDVMLKELFKREPEFFRESIAKLDVNYRKELGLIANDPVEEVTEAMYIKALDFGNLDEVMRLLNITNNNFLNSVNKSGNNAFHIACWNGKWGFAEKLLGLNPEFLKSVNENGSNVFHFACGRGHWEVAEKLLGLNPEFLKSVDNFGYNAFHIACWTGEWEVAEKLLGLKPEFINTKKNDGQTGYDIANAETRAKLDAYKQKMARAVPAAAVASTVGNPVAAPVAVAVASTTANPVMSYQQPVLPPQSVPQPTREQLGEELLRSATKGDVDAVRSVLDKDPNLLNFADKRGFTALHCANLNCHLKLVKELLSHNPDLLTGVGKLNGKEFNAFDVAFKFCQDANKKGAMLKFLFDQNPQFFAESAAKLDAEYRKQIGIVLSREVVQSVVIPALPVASIPAAVQAQSSPLLDRTNALLDAVVHAAQTEFNMSSVDLQRAINAGGIASTLSVVQKFLTETSQMYLEKGIDFAAQSSLVAKVQNTEQAFKAMMSAINPNTTDQALSSYLSRI